LQLQEEKLQTEIEAVKTNLRIAQLQEQHLVINLATAKANLEALKKFKNFANYFQ
jgi:hypothetical protein